MNKDFNKAMGAVVHRHRKLKGLSLADLGKALGVSYQQVQKSETGKNSFAAEYLPVLAKLFGVTVGDLYSEAGMQVKVSAPTPADDDAFLIARYVAKISSGKLRRSLIEFARKLAYEGVGA